MHSLREARMYALLLSLLLFTCGSSTRARRSVSFSGCEVREAGAYGFSHWTSSWPGQSLFVVRDFEVIRMLLEFWVLLRGTWFAFFLGPVNLYHLDSLFFGS